MLLRRQIPLSALFDAATPGLLSPVPVGVVSGIALDSRQVQPGDLFVALVGGSSDGHRYIPDVITRRAGAVFGSLPVSDLPVKDMPIPYIQVVDTRHALPYVSAAFYGHPARRLTVIGVTGTDGKTTTSNLIYSVLKEAGIKAGIISTVNAVIGNEVLDTGFHVTTPDAPDVQRYLAQMVEAGLSHVVLEATSHGLAQYRVAACEFDIGVVTNITHEHLDYHGSYEAYRAAKARLFTDLAVTQDKAHGNPRLAILNRDDSVFNYLNEVTTVRKLTYGLDPGADLRATGVHIAPDGIDFTATGLGFDASVHTYLAGAYNVSNCLAALAATVAGLGIDYRTACRGIANLQGVAGRMERIGLGQPFTAIVDFAHTPNALKRALEASRLMTHGKVIAVFGSAGLRDREKRRMMAEVSIQLANITVFTAEDPRTESLDGILTEMGRGAESKGGMEGKTFWKVPDRGEAIRFAVRKAQPGDLVIACGKGHEQSMCFETKEYPWDDRTAMRAALAELLGVKGPEMPYLPTQEKDNM